MLKEIGSTFWLDPNINYDCNEKKIDIKIKNFSDIVFLSSGRAAQNIVLDMIEQKNPKIKKNALIPAFTCVTVIEPFKKHNYKIFTYNIDNTLKTNIEEIKRLIIKNQIKVVLFHRYFGFDTCKNWDLLINYFKDKDVIFIEDKTQCIYSEFKELETDYVIGSLRKWDAIPDGGIALCREGKFYNKPKKFNLKMVNTKLKASYMKYNYIVKNEGKKEEFRELYEKAAELLYAENEYFCMSPISMAIYNTLNIDFLKMRRKKNYETLYQGIVNLKKIRILTPKLTKEDVPLYLALYIENREKLQKYLAEQKIYAPIIWPFEDKILMVEKSTMDIYNNILCIPIDQRYDVEDMKRILKCIEDYLL